MSDLRRVGRPAHRSPERDNGNGSLYTPGSTSALTTATQYRTAGLSVIPLEQNGKRPAFSALPRCSVTDKPKWDEYQRRLPTEEELTTWFAKNRYNVGIVCGRVSGGLVVVDFDAVESFDQWCEQDGSRWLMPTVETAHGRHVYVRVRGEVNGNHRNHSRKIDLRGEGGYVVAPYSIHPSGAVYQWVMGRWSSIPVVDSLDDIGLPESIFLRDPMPKALLPPARVGAHGMPLSISSFVARGTFQGNRDRKAYWAAHECRTAGVPAEQAVEWITWGLERSNPDRDPEEWAREKVRNAYQ